MINLCDFFLIFFWKTSLYPANGVAGTLFTVDYFNHNPLEFRKHNSKISNRYAVKPYYRRGSDDKLPFCPIIYLGLARLYPFGMMTYMSRLYPK